MNQLQKLHSAVMDRPLELGEKSKTLSSSLSLVWMMYTFLDSCIIECNWIDAVGIDGENVLRGDKKQSCSGQAES